MSTTTYEEALESGRKVGASHASDAMLMAAFLAGSGQILMGAISPKLMWTGAQARGMTTLELATLIVKDPAAAEALQWIISDEKEVSA